MVNKVGNARARAPTCTLDSGRLIFSATSSLMKMSGYRVLANSDSRMSSCVRVKVVRSRRCFRGFAASSKPSQHEIKSTDRQTLRESTFNVTF